MRRRADPRQGDLFGGSGADGATGRADDSDTDRVTNSATDRATGRAKDRAAAGGRGAGAAGAKTNTPDPSGVAAGAPHASGAAERTAAWGPPAPPILLDIVTETEERALIAAFETLELQRFRFQQWEGKRRTRTFGWKYDFGAGTFEPAEAIPDFLVPLRDRAAAFARMAPALLVQALVTRYEPGAGIGWHRDRPEFDEVVGISLGAEATMRFRRRLPDGRFERRGALLPPRSAYHLAGEIRQLWEHSITPMTVLRWSVTFRSLSARGLAKEASLQP